MTNTLERVEVSIEAKDLAGVLQRDGAAIVLNALDARQLAAINTEVDGLIGATAPGLRHPTNDFMVTFYGSETIRLDGLPGHSETFCTVTKTPGLTSNHPNLCSKWKPCSRCPISP